MRRTGKSKTCVWRWQQRFMEEGYDGLLRRQDAALADSRALASDITERVVALTWPTRRPRRPTGRPS